MKPLRSHTISRLRFIVQLVCFGVLIYGGFLVAGMERAMRAEQAASSITAGTLPVKMVKRKEAVTRLYLPATVCIYQRQGLCKGCSLFFLSETLTWRPSVEHIALFGGVLLFVLLVFGRLWCGWACPLGLVSDLLTKGRNLLRLDQLRIGPRTRDALVYTKYALLGLSLIIAAMAGLSMFSESRMSLVDPFCRICPARIFSPIFSFDSICWTDFSTIITTIFTWLGLLTFGFFFLGLFIRRFWCRLCPIGGISALFNRTGLVTLVKDGRRCTRCGTCARVCPVDIRTVNESQGQGIVSSYECTVCLRCVEACPSRGCLQFLWLGKKVAGSGKAP